METSGQSDGFFHKVYEAVKRIPLGRVATYGQIARICGAPHMSRQVGWALHGNPDPSTIPCHRVVNRFGELSSAFVFGGNQVQEELLTKEGVTVIGSKVDLSKYLWKP